MATTSTTRTRQTAQQARSARRPLLAGGVILMLVCVFALSAASRRPYFRTGSTSWHTLKISRMTEAGDTKTIAVRHEEPAVVPESITVAARLLPIYEIDLHKLPPILRAYHFRPPPIA
jgi:hypothetical protein